MQCGQPVLELVQVDFVSGRRRTPVRIIPKEKARRRTKLVDALI
jgi:hypothetical protein